MKPSLIECERFTLIQSIILINSSSALIKIIYIKNAFTFFNAIFMVDVERMIRKK